MNVEKNKLRTLNQTGNITVLGKIPLDESILLRMPMSLKVNDVLEVHGTPKLKKNCWDSNDFVTIKISFDDYDSLDYEFITNDIRRMNM